MITDTEIIRNQVFDTLNAQYDKAFACEGLEHLISVGQIAAFLALRQGLDTSLAQIAGYLHDIAFYQTHYHPGHAKKSAEIALNILKKQTTLTDIEIDSVIQAIARHSNKATVDDDLSEVIKNADVISHAIANGLKSLTPAETERINQLIENSKV